MNIRTLFRLTPRPTRPGPRPSKQPTDWTNGWTPRDWADLPAYHPVRDENR